MVLETKPFDPGLFLRDDEIIRACLQDAYDSGSAEEFMLVLKDVAKVKGMAHLAKELGLSRSSLYKTLSGNVQPRWDTIQKILTALNIKVQFAA